MPSWSQRPADTSFFSLRRCWDAATITTAPRSALHQRHPGTAAGFSEDTSNPNADICTTLWLLLVHPICFLLCLVYTNGIWCGSIIVSPNVCLLDCKSSWWMPHFTDTRNAQSASLVTSHLDYFYLVHIYVCIYIYIHAMLHSYIIVYNTNTQLFITIDPHLFRVERSTSRY